MAMASLWLATACALALVLLLGGALPEVDGEASHLLRQRRARILEISDLAT